MIWIREMLALIREYRQTSREYKKSLRELHAYIERQYRGDQV